MTSQDKPLSERMDDDYMHGLKPFPHRCRMQHPTIGYYHDDDDERCLLCREMDKAAALESLLARRTAALVKYGDHLATCRVVRCILPTYPPQPGPDMKGTCTCGFAEAMGEQK